MPQTSEGLYYALLQRSPAGKPRAHRLCTDELFGLADIHLLRPCIRRRSQPALQRHLHCHPTHLCSWKPFTRLAFGSPSAHNQKSHKILQPSIGTRSRVAQDKYASRREIKKHGRASSRRRRPAVLRRRLSTGRKTKPERRGQALRPRAGAPLTLLTLEPVSHNNAAAGRRAGSGRVR